jgi:REP element-mobilizing transposase RayT
LRVATPGLDGDGEALRALAGKPAIYHCVSRVVDRRFVLGDAEKEQFVEYMRAYESFGHLRVLTYCVMSNHFHILVEVPERPAQDPGDDELLKHLKVLYAGKELAAIRWQLAHFRQQGNHTAAEKLRQQYLSRMWDLSAFMKALKQRFTQWYNGRSNRDGYLWSDRFKSVLVEDGHAARVMAAYIDLNPVRAGIVRKPEDYRWCGYGEAMAGRQKAREGLKWLMFEKQRMRMSDEEAAREGGEWRKVLEQYQRFMADDEEQRQKTQDTRGKKDLQKNKTHGRTGCPQEENLQFGGPSRPRGGPGCAPLVSVMSEARMMRCRVRYFSDGLVLGTKAFVDGAFCLTRERFGQRRTSGARKLARAQTDLRTMRALRVDTYGDD